MAWKAKEQYKDYKPLNMNLAYGQLRPHQIDNLSDEVKEKYFEQDTPKPLLIFLYYSLLQKTF